MRFKFNGYDDNGKPTHVITDTGFVQTSRPFDEEKDGWMLNQLNVEDFEIIRAGREMEDLVNEVNYLRREIFYLKRMLGE